MTQPTHLRLPPPYEVVLQGTPTTIIPEIQTFASAFEIDGWMFSAEQETIGRNPQYAKIALESRAASAPDENDLVGIISLVVQPEDCSFLRVPPRDSWDFRRSENHEDRQRLIIYKHDMFCRVAPRDIGLRLIEQMLNDFWRRGIAMSAVQNDPGRPMARRG